MSDGPDGNAEQERLLAEALRAQAVRGPMADPARRPDDDQVLRLFSGQDALFSGRVSDTVGLPPVVADPRTEHVTRPPAQLSAGWIVLLAVLLGLAAGAVVGLVSIL
ncbi:MAG TPA: hypothetical protein VHV49_18225 [Pseudonocardiaceae bacterium]|nr:hypothetical protein [Pseudonocardiaceae bacterium]